jgi:hypothetical protein
VEDKNGEIIHTQTEDEEITVSHKGIEDQEYIDDLTKRIFELANVIEEGLKDTDVSLNSIVIDIENFPNLLVYVNSKLDSLENAEKIEGMVNDIIQSTKEESLIKENESYEVIIKDE